LNFATVIVVLFFPALSRLLPWPTTKDDLVLRLQRRLQTNDKDWYVGGKDWYPHEPDDVHLDKEDD
jgi:hypothetical protein